MLRWRVSAGFATWGLGACLGAVGLAMMLVQAGAEEPPAEASAPPSAPSVGHPLAAGMMPLVEEEIRNGLRTRGIEQQFQQFRNYAATRLNATSGRSTGNEVTGNCRLRWYDRLLRDPLSGPADAERFTRQMHQRLLADAPGLVSALALGREKMDVGAGPDRPIAAPKSPDEALAAVESALAAAHAGYSDALSPLSKQEIGELSRSLYPSLTVQTRVGHTVDYHSTARRMCDLIEKLDRRGLFAAAEGLAPLADPELWRQLAALPDDGEAAVPGVTGKVVRRIETTAGVIVVGGREKNTYDLEKLAGVAAVIDLGGDDTYQEGAVSFQRPVFVIIDLAGNDSYKGSKPGIQGSAVLGVSALIDVEGNDAYHGQDVAQGSVLAGVGLLIDAAGNDAYSALRRAQGHAIGGIGILIDRSGSDRYHAAMWDQGFGGPLGLGILDDVAGDDNYYTGGLYLDSYPETPGYEGWGQGVGAGIRGVANGGIGMILEGGGDDVYKFDYISHGGGYWLGLGFARDFAGNDRRIAATDKSFQGGARGERADQRFSNGFGCHYALGFCFDDQGDDTYAGTPYTIMSSGFAWDLSVGVLCDFAGNDRYSVTGGGTQGNGAQAGLGVLFDYDGDDVYDGRGQGYASTNITYHPMPTCGGNFSFVIDYGGKDKYGCGAGNNAITQRNSNGFLIDRPRRDEIGAPAASGNSQVQTTSAE